MSTAAGLHRQAGSGGDGRRVRHLPLRRRARCASTSCRPTSWRSTRPASTASASPTAGHAGRDLHRLPRCPRRQEGVRPDRRGLPAQRPEAVRLVPRRRDADGAVRHPDQPVRDLPEQRPWPGAARQPGRPGADLCVVPRLARREAARQHRGRRRLRQVPHRHPGALRAEQARATRRRPEVLDVPRHARRRQAGRDPLLPSDATGDRLHHLPQPGRPHAASSTRTASPTTRIAGATRATIRSRSSTRRARGSTTRSTPPTRPTRTRRRGSPRRPRVGDDRVGRRGHAVRGPDQPHPGPGRRPHHEALDRRRLHRRRHQRRRPRRRRSPTPSSRRATRGDRR